MLAADKTLLLSGFLGTLPDAMAARLARAVELDRLSGGTGLPHDTILDALRPQMRLGPKNSRTPTPLRLFCKPFEDLLVDQAKGEKQKGRIVRSSVKPVWTWLASEIMPEQLAAHEAALRDAILRGNAAAIDAEAEKLWAAASEAMLAILSDDKRRAGADRKLGARVAQDAAEMALLLSGASEITALQAKLPRPIAVLSEDVIGSVRDVYDRVGTANPDLAPYIVLVVMARLERVWEALRLVAAVSRQSTDTLVSNTDMGVVGDLLFNDLETHAAAIKAMRPAEFDVKILLEHMGEFAELSSGMVKEFGIRREGKWGLRLSKARADVSRQMETLLERAPKDVFAALPQPKTGSFGRGPKPLDLSRPPDAERVARALRAAQLMAHAKPFAAAASYSAKLTEVVDETGSELRTMGDDLLREVRVVTPETRDIVERHLGVLLDLCALVLGEEETDFLRRRSKVSNVA